MTRQELLSHCRYYKGEKENPHPYSPTFLCWAWEHKWVELSLDSEKNGEYCESTSILQECFVEYHKAGLCPFRADDNTPGTLKSFMFNRYLHWNEYGSPDSFKKWYLNEYYKDL